MKKASILLIISILFNYGLKAQEVLTQVIRGTIVDKQTNIPLVGASVVLLNSNPLKGTVTDADGKFKLENVPVGRQSIKVTYLGYGDAIIPDIIVNSSKQVVLNLSLEELAITAEEVVVTGKADAAAANNELVLISGRSFTIDQTQRYAGSLGDPSRMASNFAGVASGGSDQRNDIVIRGNSPNGLLWRLEGVDIPNPNHFSAQGSTGGPVSILNNNTLGNSDFLTGAFPAEYGNAGSGVFDLKIRNGNNEKHEFTGQIGFSGLEFMAEGPIKKGKSSYLLAYRYSSLAFFNTLGLSFGDVGIPFYQDLTFKINSGNTKMGNFGLFVIAGKSNTNLFDSEKDSVERSKISNPQDVKFGSQMGVIGISHNISLGKKAFWKTVIASSSESNSTEVDSLNSEFKRHPYFFSYTSLNRITAHSFINYKVNSKLALKYGVNFTRYGVNFTDSVYEFTYGGFISEAEVDESNFTLQTYINANYKLNDRLVFNFGLNGIQSNISNKKAVDPRFSANYILKPGQTLSLGVGVHSQMQPFVVYYDRTLLNFQNNTYLETNKNLDFSRNTHFILGYQRIINNLLRLKTEIYYQHLDQLPVTQNPSYYSTVNFGADFGFPNVDSLVNKGIGRNYGLEVTLEKFFDKGYYYLLTASVFDSKYKASDNQWRNTAFNNNYVLNFLAGKEVKLKKGVLSFNLRVVYAGGRRYVPIDKERSFAEQRIIFNEADAYEFKYRDYFRPDFKIGFKIYGKKVTQEFALDLQNVFNIKNVNTEIYNVKTNSTRTIYQLGLFPVPFYRIQF